MSRTSSVARRVPGATILSTRGHLSVLAALLIATACATERAAPRAGLEPEPLVETTPSVAQPIAELEDAAPLEETTQPATAAPKPPAPQAARSATPPPEERMAEAPLAMRSANLDDSVLQEQLSTGVAGLIGKSDTSIGARGQGLGGGGVAESYGASGLGTRESYKSGSAGASGRVAMRQAMPNSVVVAPPANTEHYTEYGTNAMTLAEQDRLSTFSIDVDTASYTIARRKLSEGALPPAASVRVEEFVNYFPYRYQGPSGDAPFAVNLEAAPHPWEPSHHLVRVGVQGKKLDEGDSRPRRLTFLVDVSGSMQSSDKLGLVKQSLHYLVERLGPEDSVALVTYAGSTRVVLPSTPVTRRERIHDAIEELSAGGSTAMGSGIELAYQQAMNGYVKGAENRVLVLSDGDANVGRTSHQEILETIGDYTKRGVTLSTLGFGSGNYKDTLMEQLADKGDGNYAYVDSFSEARRVFGARLDGTLDTIARDVKIQVEFDPAAVLSWRLVGYENRDVADRDFRNDKVDAGEIGSGHSVTALYDVILRDGALEAGEALATVRIRAKKPGPDSPSREFATNLTPRAFRGALADTSQDFRVATAAASFAEILRGSRYTQELSYAEVYRLAQGAKRKGIEEDQQLLELIARAGQLSGQSGPWSSDWTAER